MEAVGVTRVSEDDSLGQHGSHGGGENQMNLGGISGLKFMGLVTNWIWGEGRQLSRLPVDFWFVD